MGNLLMVFTFLKKYKVLVLILFLFLLISILLLTKQQDSPAVITTKPKKVLLVEEPKAKILPKLKTKVQEPVPIKVPLLQDTIDFIGKSDLLIYTKPSLEIDEIMQKQKKINTPLKDKYIVEKQEDWKIEYEIGLEDAAIQNMKTDGKLKSDMIKGKVRFSTSF